MINSVDKYSGEKTPKISQVLNCSQGTSPEGERYVIVDGEVSGEADKPIGEPGITTNTTFTSSPSLDTEPRDSANDHNSFLPSKHPGGKAVFPEYASSSEDDTESVRPQVPRPQRKTKKARKTRRTEIDGNRGIIK